MSIEDQRAVPSAQPSSSGSAKVQVPARVVEATIRLLGSSGWDDLNLERVAEAAGISRVTLWRQGIRRETLVRALLERLACDYRDSMWPVLTASGTARQRLELALATLCEVAERHLDLLLASDSAFHRAWAELRPKYSFLSPFIRILEEGASDGTLNTLGEKREVADLLFNTVCWPYVHLRGRHRWPAAEASGRVIGLVVDGIAAGR
jgi:AcrR family transcriptional regulator